MLRRKIADEFLPRTVRERLAVTFQSRSGSSTARRATPT